MINIPAAIVTQLHKMASKGAIVFLLDIELDGGTLRFARSREDITWNGYTWSAFPFDLAVLNLDSDRLPELVIKIYDVDGIVEGYIDANDGFAGCNSSLYIVNSRHLDETTPIYSISFEILKPHYQDSGESLNTIELKLGIVNPITYLWPPRMMHATLCQYPVFKDGVQCLYAGATATCDRKLATCISLGQEERWGGQPGIIGTINADI